MNGVLLINKPKNWTSRDVVNKIGGIFHTKKVGHAGTLDPMATGVLVVCLGKYTKLVEILTGHEKEYMATMKLGIKTDTGDITGEVLEQKELNVTPSIIEKSFRNFPKEYEQKVPMYSAVKINGKKLYEYAREGISVEVPTRNVQISKLNLLKIEKEEIAFSCTVSKGTFIRSLIEDIAATFGCLATMSSLCRTKSGNFKLENCKSIDEIDPNIPLLQLDDLFDYPRIEIEEDLKRKVENGNKIILNSNEDKVILSYQKKGVAIYQKEDLQYKMLFKVI